MRGLVFVLTFVLLASPAAAEVAVSYAPAREVSPLVYRSVSERDALFADVARLLKRLGERDLPASRKLSVELLDIRPAGQFEPWRPGADQVRVLRDVTPPVIKLRYALTERGRAIARGEETLSDMNYLWNLSARSSLSSFPYERELVRDWFRDRIVKLRPQRG
ncbi:DUF3016 domain-containing protein [Hansschlegelia zhihuaiae]|uniref:DUF3016 domain-containing protein n=1 Tax=Hansschlegelia zhihuaiae TaxID=405005 RepID=A0A4Q0MJK1_9HYPH|nr:DUF3016 domain-containing protein [Hansschlegelia zhihuaiae]RXF73750.1 DUF3016 domain-containing protein [Hansschlegelia zhihuaiae]